MQKLFVFVVDTLYCKGNLSVALALVHFQSDVRTGTFLVVRVIRETEVVTKVQFENSLIFVICLLHRSFHHQFKIGGSSFISV